MTTLTSTFSNTIQALQSIWNNGDLSDLSLVSDDGKMFDAHKLLLSAHSPLLRRFLTSNHHLSVTKTTLFLFDIVSVDLKNILQYLYLGQVLIPSREDYWQKASIEDHVECHVGGLKYPCKHSKKMYQCRSALKQHLTYEHK